MNSHQELTTQIKLISEIFVKPKYQIEASKQPYYLSPFDFMFLSLDPMQKGLLFHNKIPQNFLEKLKLSLSHILVDFYPLAGQLCTQKFHDEHEILVYVDSIKGPGARLIHATVDFTVSDLVSCIDVHPIVPYFFDLGEKSVNHDGHKRALLCIQITELVDGLFLGFTMNHCVADGTSLWHFISTFSMIFLQFPQDSDLHTFVNGDDDEDSCNKLKIHRKPTFKPYFPEGYGPILKLPYLEPEEFVRRFDPGPLRVRIFHFSRDALKMLKAKANQQWNIHNNNNTSTVVYNNNNNNNITTSTVVYNNNNNNNTISTFQALSGFIWRSITRVRNLQPELETSCTMSVNWRAKTKPPISEDSFGNYLAAAQSSCKVGQLVGRDLGWAAFLVHQSVHDVVDSKVQKDMENYVKAPFVGQTGSNSAFYKPNSVLIGGSARFDMYGPEFGLGKGVAVLAGYANKDDGKITANPGHKGEGSVDLEVCLRPQIMNALELDMEFMNVAF